MFFSKSRKIKRLMLCPVYFESSDTISCKLKLIITSRFSNFIALILVQKIQWSSRSIFLPLLLVSLHYSRENYAIFAATMNSGKEIRYIFNGVNEPHEKSSINTLLYCFVGLVLSCFSLKLFRSLQNQILFVTLLFRREVILR